jgi:drug/metabolite transporter (DMT)-like permease
MAFAHFYLGEKTSRSEILGLILVAIGVVFALVGSL